MNTKKCTRTSSTVRPDDELSFHLLSFRINIPTRGLLDTGDDKVFVLLERDELGTVLDLNVELLKMGAQDATNLFLANYESLSL